ncbi:MAG: SurA N-terminal domain-containing protein [Campylobacteraceae bacterium]|jgi:peptidyl-prolyl cis-trans isomerase D|nr:SurA N-terminal domain-containing protein [Campylobacteraceae bacterium]
MITWMQRHKKYLIITIWVSVIAFVGAGFVGWGSLDLNLSRSSSIAKVGNHNIDIQTFRRVYSNTFNYYNSAVYNGQLTEEIAKEIRLADAVLNVLIEEAMFLNFADELGLMALDSDAIGHIIQDANFQVNGTFNKDLYYFSLQNIGLKPNEYEEILKRQIVLSKVYSIVLNLPVTQIEKEVFGSAMFLQDRLSVATVAVEDNEVSLSDNETRTFWEANKNNFLTEKVYFFDRAFIPVSKEKLNEEDIKAYWEETKYFYKDTDDKIADYETVKSQVEAALRLRNVTESEAYKVTYLGFKNSTIPAQNNISVKESSIEYDTESFQALSVGDVLIPIKKEDGYEILKLTKVVLPEPKTYDDAKAQAAAILKANKKSQLLVQKAQARLNLFSGTDVGFVGIGTKNISGFTEEQTAVILGNVFNSKNKRGYVLVGEKAFLYNITDQKLPDENALAANDDIITGTTRQIKSAEVKRNIIELLKPRYKIEQYYRTEDNAI